MSICVVKQAVLSFGIISTVFMLKPAFNLLCLGIIPSFLVWLRSWLSPLYACITISVILIFIIIIASSSREEEEESGGETTDQKLVKDEGITAVIDGWEDENESLDATWEAIKEGDEEMRKKNNDVPSLRETPCVIRKDVGLQSRDELNQQVELFIAKFRNSMRLERLESDQRLLDLLTRGF